MSTTIYRFAARRESINRSAGRLAAFREAFGRGLFRFGVEGAIVRQSAGDELWARVVLFEELTQFGAVDHFFLDEPLGDRFESDTAHG